jgi:putative ABC transport system substrate-binding protein
VERKPNRLRAWAADLVGRRVAAIVTTNDLATLAAKTATATIPIVFLSAGDPVRNGLVAGLDRPGGNVTSGPARAHACGATARWSLNCGK